MPIAPLGRYLGPPRAGKVPQRTNFSGAGPSLPACLGNVPCRCCSPFCSPFEARWLTVGPFLTHRSLSHAIHTRLLDPALLPDLLRVLRGALFPNNTLAPARLIPDAEESLRIRRRCAETVLQLVPAPVQDVYFGPGLDRRRREVEDILDVFGDAYCNRHLMYGLVELLIVRLMPELADKGVAELWAERLN